MNSHWEYELFQVWSACILFSHAFYRVTCLVLITCLSGIVLRLDLSILPLH